MDLARWVADQVPPAPHDAMPTLLRIIGREVVSDLWKSMGAGMVWLGLGAGFIAGVLATLVAVNALVLFAYIVGRLARGSR